MKKALLKIWHVILWLWQGPQHALALAWWGILALFGLAEKGHEEGPEPGDTIIRYKKEEGRGCNLGKYSFLRKRHKPGGTAEAHECKGHAGQSQRLGPLYLPAAGIFSACLGPWQKLFLKNKTQEERDKWYYRQWTEAWADRLGGVKRK